MSSMDGMRSRVLVCRRHYGGFPVALGGSLESGVVHATSGVASRKCGVTIAGDRADIWHVWVSGSGCESERGVE